MDNITSAEKNKLALTYAPLVGIIYIIIITAVNLTIGNMILFYVMKFIGYVLYFVILGILATRIKKANGGYIEFREIFGALFIMILVAELMYFVYSFIYTKYIDPHFMDRMKVAYLSFMEKMKTPDDKLEEASKNFDKAIAESKTFDFGKSLLSYFEIVVMDCLFGLIVCLIVKKPRPVVANF